MEVARLTEDGDFDESFGSAGVVRRFVTNTDSEESTEAESLKVDDHGRVLVSAYTYAEECTSKCVVPDLLRLSPTGQVQTSFEPKLRWHYRRRRSDGSRSRLLTVTTANILGVGPRDSIELRGGKTLVRITHSGVLDRKFNGGGIVQNLSAGREKTRVANTLVDAHGRTLYVLKTSRVKAWGTQVRFRLARLTANGERDRHFNPAGVVIPYLGKRVVPRIFRVRTDNAGRVVVVAGTNALPPTRHQFYGEPLTLFVARFNVSG